MSFPVSRVGTTLQLNKRYKLCKMLWYEREGGLGLEFFFFGKNNNVGAGEIMKKKERKLHQTQGKMPQISTFLVINCV